VCPRFPVRWSGAVSITGVCVSVDRSDYAVSLYDRVRGRIDVQQIPVIVLMVVRCTSLFGQEKTFPSSI